MTAPDALIATFVLIVCGLIGWLAFVALRGCWRYYRDYPRANRRNRLPEPTKEAKRYMTPQAVP